MTVRKKLMISNILMIVIPVCLAVVFGITAFTVFGRQYWETLEAMYNDENGVYSAQSIVYAYKDSVLSLNHTKDMPELEKQLSRLGYHYRIRIDDREMYNSLTSEEQKISESFEEAYEGLGSLTLSDEKAAIIKSTFQKDSTECEITAVRMADSVVTGYTVPYVKRYVISFLTGFVFIVIAAVLLTNFVLSRWITHMILKPLNILKKGTKEIADGNLQFELDYSEKDEFGEVCREFDIMRTHLQKSVDTQLAYEKYRKELIAGISHDLRTPLTSIKGYVEGLKDGIANTEEKKERYYNAIHTRALDMEALIDSLSTFAKLENKQYKYQLEKVNMDEYLRQCIRDYSEEAERKKAVILYDNHVKDAEVLIDLQEIHRVFINIFENSIKYRLKNQNVIRMEVSKQNENLKILVADDGPGVPERELSDIFNIFYRGDASRTKPENGSGLGLAIVKQIIEGHHGVIRAYNEKGLVIEIILPMIK